MPTTTNGAANAFRVTVGVRLSRTSTFTELVTDSPSPSTIVTVNAYVPDLENVAVVDFDKFVPFVENTTAAGPTLVQVYRRFASPLSSAASTDRFDFADTTVDAVADVATVGAWFGGMLGTTLMEIVPVIAEFVVSVTAIVCALVGERRLARIGFLPLDRESETASV